MVLLPRVLLAVGFSALSCAAQEEAPRDPIVRAAVGLRDDAHWRRHALQLIVAGSRAAPALATELRDAASTRPEQVRRILRVLDRLGIAAAPAAPAVWDVLLEIELETALQALGILPYISGVGDTLGGSRVAKKAFLSGIFGVGTSATRRMRASYRATHRLLLSKRRLKADRPTEQLVAALRDTKQEGCYAVVQLLGTRGGAARAALPRLEQLLLAAHRRLGLKLHPSMERQRFGRLLADAILAIDPRSPAAASAYGWIVLHDDLPELRLRAADELALLGPHARRASVFLLAFLRGKQPDPELACRVINCTAMLGAKARWATDSLQKLAETGPERVRKRAASALRRILRRGAGR